MTLAEKIAQEVRDLPDELNNEILDFILFIERRRPGPAQPSVRPEPEWDQLQLDTRGWCFDRDEANAR
jgi:hypothetical protein